MVLPSLTRTKYHCKFLSLPRPARTDRRFIEHVRTGRYPFVLSTDKVVHLLLLSDDMNQLQHISEEEYGKVLVTLNPPFEPKPETIISRHPFSHPMFTADVSLRFLDSVYLSSCRHL